MQEKVKNKAIIIGTVFLRVIKNKDLYNVFKKRFKSTGKKSFCTPFEGVKCADIYSLFNVIGEQTKHEAERMHDKYGDVVVIINHLLRYYLEGGGVNPMSLGMIGQEIFDISCYRIYGEEFLREMEMEERNDSVPKPRNEFENYCVQVYLSSKNKLMESGINDYPTFLKQCGGTLRKNYYMMTGKRVR